MKEFLVALVCLISLVTAGVLDNSDEELSIVGQERDSEDNGRIGVQRISQMTHEDLMRQKFLLDILQHINEPIVNEELLQSPNAAQNQLIEDQSLYKEGIDEKMSHVIELSRRHELLGKNEHFTIANEEHTCQMIGLYRLLVSARDWDTLKKNIIHARKHVNGVLLVNALFLAIRDREDTEHLIVPGMHEILPELYLDEELVQGAKQINLNQLIAVKTSTTKTVGPERPSILEMIGMNKLLRDKTDVSSLDRRELWMPWREMRMEIAARKAGKGIPGDDSISDERIILTPTKSEGLEGDERGLGLLTEDVGFQAFVQSFMADLCLQEEDAKQGSESEMEREQKRAGFGQIGLHEDAESHTKSGMRYYDQQTRGKDMWNTRVVTLDEDDERVLAGDRRTWTHMNDDNDDDTPMQNEQNIYEKQYGAQIGRVGLNRNVGSMMEHRIRNRYEQSRGMNNDPLPTGRRYWDQSNQDQSVAGMDRSGLNRNIGSMLERGIPNGYEQAEGMHINPLPTGRIFWGPRNQDQSEARMGRVGPNRNMGSAIHSGVVRNRFEQAGDPENIWNTHSDPYNDASGRQYWSRGNQYTNDEYNGPHNQGWDDETSNLQWLQSHSPMNQRNGFNPYSVWNSQRDSDIHQHLLGGGPPTHTADDKNSGYRKKGKDSNKGKDWTPDLHQGGSERGQGMEDRYGINSHWATGMPMDWNRHMAMHRQKSSVVEDRQGSYQGGYQQNAYVGHTLRELDINDERLLPFSQRKINKWSSSGRQGVQQLQDNQFDGPRGVLEAKQPWMSKNSMENTGNQYWMGGSKDRAWTTMTAARGMGNMGVHEEDEINGQHGIGGMSDLERWGKNHIGPQNTRWTEGTHNKAGDWGRTSNEGEAGGAMGLGKKRYSRSLGSSHQHSIEQVRSGELLLHNLQQLVARINLEQISHGLNPKELECQDDITHGLTSPEESQSRALFQQINDVEKHLRTIVRAEVEHKIGVSQNQNVRDQAKIDDIMGDALMGKNVEHDSEVNILNILRALIQQTEHIRGGSQKSAKVSLDLRDPTILHLLRRIVHIADGQRQQQLGEYRKEDLEASGITINEVQVDKLKTYMDENDVDLMNALDVAQINTLSTNGKTRMVIARQQRLNHKDFSIKINVSSDRDQHVVVRTLLGPKLKGTTGANTTQLNSQRHNYILLDAHVVELHNGRNQIKRKSRDITWTAADTTTYSEIYKRVMRALKGEQVDLISDVVRGQTCRFPHHLLLPHGRDDGLPMQMLVVITPVEDEDRSMQQWSLDQRVCGIGVGSTNLDRLPLGYPLDRPIKNATELSALPNMHLMDVQIYHDKHGKGP